MPKNDNEKPKSTETPREKFLRLAPPRTDAALKRISLLSNLSGAGYEYEPAEVQQIIDALQDEVNDLKRKFQTVKSTGRKATFTFASSKRRLSAVSE